MKTGCGVVCCATTIVGASTAKSSIAAVPRLAWSPGLEPLEAATLPIRIMTRTEPSDNGRARRGIRSGSSSEPLDKRRGKPAHVQHSLLDPPELCAKHARTAISTPAYTLCQTVAAHCAATGASHPSSARGVHALWAIVTTPVPGAGDVGSRLKPIRRIQIFAGLIIPEMLPQNYSPPSKGAASKAVDFREDRNRSIEFGGLNQWTSS